MYVLDASVIIKWFVEEEYTDKALKFRNQHETGNFELCCPDLTLFEISNVMSFKQDITNKEIYEIITTIFDLEMEIIAPTSDLLRQSVSLSREKSISVYDSVYVSLANKLGYEFVTADEKLYNAVNLSYVKLLKEI